MPVTDIDWTGMLATAARGLAASEIRKALDAALDPDLISMAGGTPAAELFPAERFRAAFAKVLRDHPVTALQYGKTEGAPALRELVADRLSREGPAVDPGRVLITNGSQQGLDLAGRLLIDPGDVVIVESPTYVGALDALRQHRASFLPVATDADGIRTDRVEELLAADRAGPRRIRMIYTMPNFANPSGLTMSAARRRELVELSHRFGVPVVEDDAYGELRFEGPALPSLSSLDEVGTVIRLGSMSKILAPGLRIGWITAHPRFLRPLIHIKERADLHSATGAQLAVVEVARDGFLDAHVAALVAAYRARRDAAVEAVAAHLPPEVGLIPPRGGFYLWCVLPPGLDATALLTHCVSTARVAFVPGTVFHAEFHTGFCAGFRAGFHAEPAAAQAIRIAFSSSAVPRVREGIRRIGTAIGQLWDGGS